MSTVIDSLERAQLRRVPAFDAGDRLRVHFQVIEGTRRRTQVFEGVVIKQQGHGARETFTVRKQSFGVGVERTFPLHRRRSNGTRDRSRGDVRRAKLYYLRPGQQAARAASGAIGVPRTHRARAAPRACALGRRTEADRRGSARPWGIQARLPGSDAGPEEPGHPAGGTPPAKQPVTKTKKSLAGSGGRAGGDYRDRAPGLALAIQAFVVKPYRIPSGSMLPTLHIDQRVLVNRLGTHFSSPHVGDIIVFHPPKD